MVYVPKKGKRMTRKPGPAERYGSSVGRKVDRATKSITKVPRTIVQSVRRSPNAARAQQRIQDAFSTISRHSSGVAKTGGSVGAEAARSVLMRRKRK